MLPRNLNRNPATLIRGASVGRRFALIVNVFTAAELAWQAASEANPLPVRSLIVGKRLRLPPSTRGSRLARRPSAKTRGGEHFPKVVLRVVVRLSTLTVPADAIYATVAETSLQVNLDPTSTPTTDGALPPRTATLTAGPAVAQASSLLSLVHYVFIINNMR